MSCEFQEQKCREYCEYRGLDVRNVYYDKGISGKRADNRPGLQKAMQEVCQRQGVLVVYDLFRLARSTRDAINILERLERRKADLAIITQQIDTSTPMGRAFFQMAAVFGELERANTAERTRATLVARQAAGFRVGRYPPYGWALDPQFPSRMEKVDGKFKKIAGRIVQEPREQMIIRCMINCFNQGMGFKEIVDWLNERGYKPRPTNKGWDGSYIKKILARNA
jgi:DNA invertase Pin-like site-specific DNA recombinase